MLHKACPLSLHKTCPTYIKHVRLTENTIVWPRGFPLDQIKNESTRSIPLPGTVLRRRIGLIQSLANHDPDVDAIYRLTRHIPFNFTPAMPALPILIPQGTLVPLNAQVH